MAQDNEKYLEGLEEELKGSDQELGYDEISKEERDEIQKHNMDEDLLKNDDGEVYHVEEMEYIIKDILKHQDKAFKYDKIEPTREQIADVQLKSKSIVDLQRVRRTLL